MRVQTRLETIAAEIMQRLGRYEGVQAYFVGGYVRDRIMGYPCSDIDIEVFGMAYDILKKALEGIAGVRRVDAVGKSFGVLKVTTDAGVLDFAIPRRERRTGVGHTSFDCDVDPFMSTREAQGRRDFTINAVYMTADGRYIDHYDGLRDIEMMQLDPTTDRYMEDPLRVLRGMQFASRFNLSMTGRAIGMSKAMFHEYESISVERIWMEWKKWALGEYPAQGLRLLSYTGWLSAYYELAALQPLAQDLEYHPEGGVWAHTLHVVDAAAEIACHERLDEEDTLVLLFSALLHDVGKITCTTTVDGRVRSPGHASAGEPLVRSFLSSIGAPAWLVDQVVPLVREHMVHIGTQVTDRVVRRLAVRLAPATVPMLRLLVLADMSGRPPLEPRDPLAPWVHAAERVQADTGGPAPVLMGRHLISLGMTPGPTMGSILADAYEAQLDGEFETLSGALVWAETRLVHST